MTTALSPATNPDITDLIGKPFRHGGRGPDAYDCAGLVVEVLRRRGIHLSIPDTPGLLHDQMVSMREILRAKWVDVPRAFPGCVVYFRGVPGHVGVMLSPFTFLHVAEDVGRVCIERWDSPLWSRRFVGFYEYGGAQ